MLDTHQAIGGSPQQPGLKWTHLRPCAVSAHLAEDDLAVSSYLVQQVYKHLHLGRRKMSKCLCMKQVAHRDEQFITIAQLTQAFLEAGLPVLSLDTKKKEYLGPFYRPGTGFGTAALPVYDHDFNSAATGRIIPHGIYDVGQNRGYLTLGLSHDTSAFACDNLRHFWIEHLQWQYRDAEMVLLLCDGGGSNHVRHYMVKQDLYRLAQALELTLVVAHYPAYCSKWNPIEHRLFCHLTHAWQGTTLLSVEQAQALAAQTTTQTGLEVAVWINRREYPTGRQANEEFKENLDQYIDFSEKLPLWNYQIHPRLL